MVQQYEMHMEEKLQEYLGSLPSPICTAAFFLLWQKTERVKGYF